MQRIEKLDRRIIFLVAIIVISYVTLRPLGLPLIISQNSRQMYALLQAVPTGAKILVNVENSPADFRVPDVQPGLMAALNYLNLAKNAKFYFVNTGGPVDADKVIEQYINSGDFNIKKTPGKEYGKDWVNFGWISGMEAGLAAWAKDIIGFKPNDYYGNSLASMQIMQGVKSVTNFDVWILSSKEIVDSEALFRQIGSVYNFKPLLFAAASHASTYLPYVSSGQALGLIYGARQGAEMEKLTEVSGLGLITIDSLSILVVICIAFIAIGNIPVIAARVGRKAVPGEKVKE